MWLLLLNKLLQYFTEQQIFVLGTCLINIVIFWGYNLVLYLCYTLKLFKQFQSQPDAIIDLKLVWPNIFDTLLSHLVVLPVATYFLFYGFVYFGMSVSEPLPSVSVVLRDLLVSVLLLDGLGYWMHRAMHHKSIYKFIHKQHHQYKANIGIAAVYSHPIEDFANTFQMICGPLFMGSHVLVFWLWISIGLWEAINAHSGYHFLPLEWTSWLSGGAFHEFHHSHNVGNYGQFFSFWDYMCGTDVAYRQYMRKKREVCVKEQ